MLACAACGGRSNLYDFQAEATSVGAGSGGAGAGGQSTGGGAAGGVGAGGSNSGGAGNGGSGGGVVCEPGAVTALVTGEEAGVLSLAMNAERLFWGTLDGNVKSQPLAGGSSTLVAAHQTPVALAADPGRLYWIDGSQGTVVAQDASGGEPVVLAKEQVGAQHLALDESSLYWTGSGITGVAGSVVRAGKDGSNLTVLASQADQTMAVAVDEQAVYFTVWGAGKGVFRVGKMGGEVTSLIPELTIDSPAVTALAVQNGTLYVAVSLPFAKGQIWSVPTMGGDHAVVVDGIASPNALAVDATHIYWSASASEQPYGSVGRAPLQGGPAEILVTADVLHQGLVLDDHAVYFGRLWGFEMLPPEDGASVLRWCKTP